MIGKTDQLAGFQPIKRPGDAIAGQGEFQKLGDLR
jgi:hypothetical protein